METITPMSQWHTPTPPSLLSTHDHVVVAAVAEAAGGTGPVLVPDVRTVRHVLGAVALADLLLGAALRHVKLLLGAERKVWRAAPPDLRQAGVLALLADLDRVETLLRVAGLVRADVTLVSGTWREVSGAKQRRRRQVIWGGRCTMVWKTRLLTFANEPDQQHRDQWQELRVVHGLCGVCTAREIIQSGGSVGKYREDWKTGMRFCVQGGKARTPETRKRHKNNVNGLRGGKTNRKQRLTFISHTQTKNVERGA